MGKGRGAFWSTRWSLLVAFMLVLPQVGVSIFGVFVDFYRIVLFVMGANFLILFFMRRIVVSRSVVLFWATFFLAILLPWGAQVQIQEYGDFYSHISSELGRYDPNLTYGVVSYVSRDFFGVLGLRVLAIFLMGFLLSIYLSQMTVLMRINFLCAIVFSAAIFQIFYMALYFLGGLDFFVKNFMVGATADQFSGGVSSRLGLLRFPGGFSEPSFMAVVLFGAIFSIFWLLYAYGISLSFTRRLFLILSSFMLFFTTASMMIFFVALFCAFFFFLRKVNKISFVLCGLAFFGISIFLQIFSIFVTSDMIPVGLESISVRQLMVTPLGEMSWSTYLFGYAFSEVYNFPFITNIVLQVGLLGALLLCGAFLFLGPERWVFLSFFLLVISVSPNFGYSYLYVCLGLLLGAIASCKVGSLSGNKISVN